MRILILALCVVCCTGCANRTAAKRYFATAIVADGVSTRAALERGCTEANRVYLGANGDQILAVNVVVAALLEMFGEHLPAAVSYTFGTLRFGVAVHNAELEC